MRLPSPSADAVRRYHRPGLWDAMLLDDYLVDAAARAPSSLAVVDGAVRLDYALLLDRVTRASAGLRRLGVGRGDVVSSQLPNWWEALVLHLTSIRIGAVSNPLMPILREREMRFSLGHSGSAVLVVPAEFRGPRAARRG